MLDHLLDANALPFTIAAAVGTAFFMLRMAMMLLGGIGGDADLGVDADVSLDPDGIDGADLSADAFKLLSIQSIAAFVMGFGWGGLVGLIGLDWRADMSLLLALAFGAAMVWLVGLVMKAVYDLRSSGNIPVADAVGLEGTVYAGVPERGAGSGQVRVVIHERSRIYQAVSRDQHLPTGTAVRVVGVGDDGRLTVAPIEMLATT